ncbi:unnamed protein product [Adineta steineri]|uniref:Condensation domain-containing protein n=1 Tax=Adineta steineri TaxID=433720 RepID=A0A814RWQ0_9BILA|nr:unnamed protein product [Adineta steineri]CAF1196981.1 unnamed protein product [Adineta steineri]
MSTMMEMALLQKIQEQEMMPSPASSTIPAAGCSHGAASFAQERIWLDEKIYHDPSISPAMHNVVLPLVIKHGSKSIERIRSAIVAVLEQHEILRTAIYFDKNRNMLVQAVQSVDNNDAYSFEITANNIQSPNEVADLLRNESVKHFAELEHGLVVRCHLVKVGSEDDMDKLYPQDLVIFIFHGVAFDYNSIGSFLLAFTKAYDQMELDVESEMKSIVKTNDAALSLYTEQPWLHANGIASHDMNLKMIHNQSSQTTYCIFECSADCYDEVTVSNIGRYFQNLLSHIFTENTKTIGFDPVFEKIGNLSLLPMNVENLSNVIESLRHFSEIKPASYAQHQIWLDEERRLHLDEPQLATHNMVFCYRLSADHTLSVQQLRYALDLVVDKHQSLRTALIFDTTKSILTQRIVDQQNHKNNQFSVVESIYETDEQLDEIMHNETHNPHVFDLAQGRVFRCHFIIGIMAIEMSGSVYCPLSPRDPQNRLYTLIEQTQSRIVLIHWLTRAKFHDNDIVLIDIHSIVANHDSKGDADIDRLSNVRVTSNDIAYLIFTSGSTGIPKAVRVLNLNNTEQYYILFGSIISGSIAPS